MKIKKIDINPDLYGLKCPRTLVPEYITIHETKDNSSPEFTIKWMSTSYNPVSFHYAVGDIDIWQGVDNDRTAYHCGDGAEGPGNNKSIGIELCYSKSEKKRYEAVKANAAKLVAALMKTYNIPIEKVVQHNYWSGENCPERIRKEEGSWEGFLLLCEKEFKKLNRKRKAE